MQIIILLVILALLVLVLFNLRQSASKNEVANLAQLVRLGRAKALVENVDKVRMGQTKADVEAIIGKADNPNGNEWLYYLDEHSGYVITFDSTDQVSNVQSWKS